MTFSFQWQDPSEMSAFKVLAEGEGNFKVQHVYELDEQGRMLCSKKSGEQMIKVELMVTDSNNASSIVHDYILASQAWKLHNLCKAIGRVDVYEAAKDGSLNCNKLLGEKGKCLIATDTPSDPKYNARSVIAKYLESEKAPATKHANTDYSNMQDDVPF